MRPGRILVVGAGPTGLGAAYRLHELGYEDFLVLEGRKGPGGLASSEKSKNGFVYDIGGHVLFSHFRYFDELFDRMLGPDYQELQREAWVWIRDRFVPYPFQNNVQGLPEDDVLRCLLGVLAAQRAARTEFANFEELIYGVFGQGIAELFMMPYNFKVWAHPPRELGTRWIGERVPVVDLERMITNVVRGKPDVSWGPNNTFKYPREGGTGGLFAKVAARVATHVRYGDPVAELDPVRRIVKTRDGREEPYDALINTSPIDQLVGRIRGVPARIREAARRLRHSGSAIVGVGLRQPPPTSKCWIYFPESNCPFYRVTYLSNYSPEVVPDAAANYSLLAEVSFSDRKPLSRDNVVDQVVEGFVNTRLLSPQDLRDVVDTHLIVRDYTYPIPTTERDAALAVIQPYLASIGIHSRGRFGAWKYEIGNMDHSVQMGAEIVGKLLLGEEELCWRDRILPKKDQSLGLVPTPDRPADSDAEEAASRSLPPPPTLATSAFSRPD